MEDEISMAEFEAAQRHCHPGLDIGRKEDK